MLRPQKYKRFFPVYFLKMASDLKKGKKRQEIVRELSEKHGVPALTAEAYLSKHFPVSKLRKGVSIDSLLWQAREKMLSAEDRSRIGRKGWEGKSPEERSRIVRKGWEGKSPEERSRIARERWANVSPEERSRIVRKGWEAKTEKSQVAKRSRTRETLKNIVDRKKGFAPDEHNLLIVLQQIFSEKEINKIKPSIQNLRPEEFLPIFEAIYDSELLYRQQITFENFIFFRENLMKKARLSKPRTEQALIVINNTLQRRLSS